MNNLNGKETHKTKIQKPTPNERKKKIEIETQNPIPPVPNQAWTEMNVNPKNQPAYPTSPDNNTITAHSDFFVDTTNVKNNPKPYKYHFDKE